MQANEGAPKTRTGKRNGRAENTRKDECSINKKMVFG
jgi:hypothetical protein